MSKIVEFPKNKIVREMPANQDAVEQAKVKSKTKFADNITEDIIDLIVEELENRGVDIDDEMFIKDFSITVDALRATVYRQFDIEHHLHNFIDENVTIIDRKTGKPLNKSEDVDTEE